MKHIVSLSGGKDSTAMLLRMIEKEMPIDEIIFCDTGLEFPQMYEHLELLKINTGIDITVLSAEHSFEHYMFDHVKTKGKNVGEKGYSWSDSMNRWCTTLLKTQVIDRYLTNQGEYTEYVGIAYDERERAKDKVYPLIEWELTEKECLEYCYSKGYYWGGLYELFNRVSCWCCPLQSLPELRKLREHFPDKWQKMMNWDKKTYRKFRPDYSMEQLEEKFHNESMQMTIGGF